MTETEFKAKLLALYARAEGHRQDKPWNSSWPIVADALKLAILAYGRAEIARAKPLPIIKPLDLKLVPAPNALVSGTSHKPL